MPDNKPDVERRVLSYIPSKPSELRDDSPGHLHIISIFIPELRNQHLFFLWYPEEVENAPCNDPEYEDQCVCEHDALRDDPDPEMGIYRVTDVSVNPGPDQGGAPP